MVPGPKKTNDSAPTLPAEGACKQATLTEFPLFDLPLPMLSQSSLQPKHQPLQIQDQLQQQLYQLQQRHQQQHAEKKKQLRQRQQHFLRFQQREQEELLQFQQSMGCALAKPISSLPLSAPLPTPTPAPSPSPSFNIPFQCLILPQSQPSTVPQKRVRKRMRGDKDRDLLQPDRERDATSDLSEPSASASASAPSSPYYGCSPHQLSTTSSLSPASPLSPRSPLSICSEEQYQFDYHFDCQMDVEHDPQVKREKNSSMHATMHTPMQSNMDDSLYSDPDWEMPLKAQHSHGIQSNTGDIFLIQLSAGIREMERNVILVSQEIEKLTTPYDLNQSSLLLSYVKQLKSKLDHLHAVRIPFFFLLFCAFWSGSFFSFPSFLILFGFV